MIPRELARRIRRIQIITTKAADDVLAGEYESVFKGRGMEFDEVREYQPGDEVRSIDWNVTARTGRPFVKRYREERQLTIVLMVDLSASGAFGTVGRLKNEAAAEVCAMLAFCATRNRDNVGLMAFTDRVELFIPPRKGTTHVLRVIREILSFKPGRVKTDLGCALDTLGRVIRRRAVVFLISDFQAEGHERALRIHSRRHDMIAVLVRDPAEARLPDVGLLALADAETGETVLMDTGSRQVRSRYERLADERDRRLVTFLRSIGMDRIDVETGGDNVGQLVRFFRNRQGRRRTR